MPKKRIILKISGEWLKNKDNIVCHLKLKNLLNQVQILSKEYNIAIVLGGGNIFRGKISETLELHQSQGDFAGMLATVINGLLIKDYFNNNNLKTKLYSALDVPKITEVYNLNEANIAFNSGTILIFVGGVGMPFFTTDSCAAVRAAELNINTILFGKNGADGLYDKDPNIYKDAKFINSITFEKMIEMRLNAVDLTAAIICIENNIDGIIFDINSDKSFINALINNTKKTIIKAK